MLEALTIYSKGGLVLYQYAASPSMVGAENAASHARQAINNSIQARIRNNNSSATNQGGGGGDSTLSCGFHIADRLTFVWMVEPQYVVCAMYPDILFEGPRQYLRTWAETLVRDVTREYRTYNNDHQQQQQQQQHTPLQASSSSSSRPLLLLSLESCRPNPIGFDATFRLLLERSKTQKQQPESSATTAAVNTAATESGGSGTTASSTSKKLPQQPSKPTTTASSKKAGRHWIGEAKVNDKTMAELDRSDTAEAVGGNDSRAEQENARLEEAKRQFIPTEEERQQAAPTSSTSDAAATTTWSSSLASAWQRVSQNKALTADDVKPPLERLQQLLVEKNVASSIASKLCQSVSNELVGKKLQSLYRVQTAVQQGLEKAIRHVLERHQIDVLRLVLAHKEAGEGGGGGWFSSGTSSNTKRRRPYVICVLGINGIGKTTTLAKLAYLFQSNGCTPLLVAADTFRSGAVEQLNTHAQCLGCDLFAQGYAKDPASVVTAALRHAGDPALSPNPYDVMLIDTAGRMQTNNPLLKELAKLVDAAKPDCVVWVGEALVGHDALSQFQTFRSAVGGKVHGMILTKFDAAGERCGAALTLTHESDTPLAFVGTGQKYHHLQRPDVGAMVASLLA